MSIADVEFGASASRRRSILAAIAAVAILFLAGEPVRAAAEDGSIAGLKARFTDINGVKTRYYEAGAGEPIDCWFVRIWEQDPT